MFKDINLLEAYIFYKKDYGFKKEKDYLKEKIEPSVEKFQGIEDLEG